MSTEQPVERVPLDGIPLDPLTLDQACDWVFDRAGRSQPLSIITTVNLQLLRTARMNAVFADVLKHHSALNLVDGWPVAWLLRRGGVVYAARAPGSDLTSCLLRGERARALGIYLLGDSRETIEAVSRRGNLEGWSAHVRGADSPAPTVIDDEHQSLGVVNRINASNASILLVAFGAPRQELWLKTWRHKLAPRVGIGIGGSLKFVAWPERRAPAWMRRRGLEWFHRLALEPARMIPRYTKDALELSRLAAMGLRPPRFKSVD